MNVERNRFSLSHRAVGIASLAALAPLLFCGSTAPQSCSAKNQADHDVVIAASVGASVAVGVIVLVEVNKSHHNIKGCVTSGPNGLEVQVPQDKGFETYDLTGVTTDIKEGDLVRIHGSKEKKAKGSAGDRVFQVQRLSKDYGPCKAMPKPPASSISAAE